MAGLNKWVEIGNSGMFRPEMLRPMGFPEVLPPPLRSVRPPPHPPGRTACNAALAPSTRPHGRVSSRDLLAATAYGRLVPGLGAAGSGGSSTSCVV